jgi:ACS family pantothenate transporter-like MFS transporter
MRYDDYLFRSVVIASMNMMSNAVNAWWSIVFYSATYAPYFTVRILVAPSQTHRMHAYHKQRGMWAMIATCIFLGIWTSGLLFKTVRAEKRRLLEADQSYAGKEANIERVAVGKEDGRV